MELDRRKLDILTIITRMYLETGEPVGSKLVAELLGGRFSPATIRNDMAVLYELGLLEQPYTSAGRIPSHIGLRLYIDRLMEARPLTYAERNEIEAIFNRVVPDTDELLEDSARALADMTGYAAVSTTVYKNSAYVKRIELISATAKTVVILLITSSGLIRNKVCRVSFVLTQRIIEFFSSFANSRIIGRSLSEITAEYIRSMAITLGEYTDIFLPLLTAIYDICRETCQSKLYYSGESNLMENEKLRQVANNLLRSLHSREEILSIMESEADEVSVSIGAEISRPEFNDSSVLFSRYRIGDDSFGIIGLIGPLRMDYAKLIPHLQYFSDMLGKLINDTLHEDDDQG